MYGTQIGAVLFEIEFVHLDVGTAGVISVNRRFGFGGSGMHRAFGFHHEIPGNWENQGNARNTHAASSR